MDRFYGLVYVCFSGYCFHVNQKWVQLVSEISTTTWRSGYQQTGGKYAVQHLHIPTFVHLHIDDLQLWSNLFKDNGQHST